MQLSETVHVALDALRANKLRSFLTMLGIVIGIAAVIAMVALGRGAQQSVNQRIAALGTTLLTVFPGQGRGFGGIQITDRIRLTMEDAEALEARGTRMTAIQPEMTRNLQLTYGNKNISTNVVGATANYLTVRNFRIDNDTMGALIIEVDLEGKSVDEVVENWIKSNESTWRQWGACAQ